MALPSPSILLIPFAFVSLATAASAVSSGAIEEQAGRREQITLDVQPVPLTATLQLPSGRGRPPVVLVTADRPASELEPLASALSGRGNATVRYDPADDVPPDLRLDHAAAWVTLLRNDPRFRTVSVLGEGASAGTALVAARVARADAFVLLGAAAPGPSAGELSVPVHRAPSEDAAAVAEAADFLAAVEPFGLRGGRSRERPRRARLSPRITRIARVEGARISIEYGQPAKRGRDIWGGLVRWDEVWMPGADEATTLTTDHTLVFDDEVTLVPGDYTIYSLPRADGFTLILSGETGQFHTEYHQREDVGRVEMTMAEQPDVTERLTFLIEPAPAGGGTFALIWGERAYAVPFAVRSGELR